MAAFDGEKRGRLLALMGTGRSLEEACAEVRVNPSTVGRWAMRGRSAECSVDERRFAEQFDGLKERSGDSRLEIDDCVRLLERAATRGSVTAVKLLMDWLLKQKDGETGASTDLQSAAARFDELSARRRKR